VYDRLRQLLSEFNMTQNTLAEKLGVTGVTISRWMNEDDRDMGLKYIEKILKIFEDVNPVWFLTGHGEMLKHEKYDIGMVQEDPVRYGNEIINEVERLKARIRELEKYNSFIMDETIAHRKTAESAMRLLEKCEKKQK